jgi:7-keto-8-aminopelargonate synthetase-like enzyme
MKLNIVAAMEKELVLETMIKSLGFSDAVVTVSSDADNVNVFINTEELTYDTALAIYTMLEQETDISAENVRIIPVYSES